ncbi:MAG: acyltransferase [Ignavibacteriae bacterium]|nr:acyltransferase [Ignavibacteriota bacterium]
MKLAIVQTNPIFGNILKNVEDALGLMNSVEANLFVLPELFNTGYNFQSQEEVKELSEDDSSFTMQTMIEFAKKKSCYVVFGYAEKVICDQYKKQRTTNQEQSTINHEPSYYNSSALIGPEGIIGKYRKVHLYYREKLFFTPGNLGFPMFDLPLGKIGMMICFDWFYPESARSLALHGAHLIAHPANLVLPYCPDAMITRCLENKVFAATTNRVGVENRNDINLTYIGTSQVVSNRGKILARCSDDKPEIVVVEIDLMQAENKRLNEFNDLLADRRPEQYTL